MIRELLQVAALLAVSIQVSGQAISRPDVPDQIKVPAGEDVVLETHGSGSQIYVCQAGKDGKPTWVFKAPEADLRDQQGTVVIHHFAGPTWKDNDGSQVSGKTVAQVASPDPNSIPWLLLTAASHSGAGILDHVTSIQRIHTKGGAAPPADDCNTSKLNQEAKRSYTADYYFYAPAK